jgi:hypothetical protein
VLLLIYEQHISNTLLVQIAIYIVL